MEIFPVVKDMYESWCLTSAKTQAAGSKGLVSCGNIVSRGLSPFIFTSVEDKVMAAFSSLNVKLQLSRDDRK